MNATRDNTYTPFKECEPPLVNPLNVRKAAHIYFLQHTENTPNNKLPKTCNCGWEGTHTTKTEAELEIDKHWMEHTLNGAEIYNGKYGYLTQKPIKIDELAILIGLQEYNSPKHSTLDNGTQCSCGWNNTTDIWDWQGHWLEELLWTVTRATQEPHKHNTKTLHAKLLQKIEEEITKKLSNNAYQHLKHCQ